MIPHHIIGLFDAYGSCRHKVVFKEEDGSKSQMWPGHFDHFYALAHKRWRWLVAEHRLMRELMDWEPDAEELDRIERIVAQASRNFSGQRYRLEGEYPNWPLV